MINEEKISSYLDGTNIKTVSSAPEWVLWLRGLVDSYRGEGVARAQILKLLDRCTELEVLESLSAENLLFDVRRSGAEAISTIRSTTEYLSNFPDYVHEKGPLDIRENLRRRNARKMAEKGLAEAKQSLYVISEAINNEETILHERIIKIRKNTSSIINAYIKGLRSGRLKSFELELRFSENAIECYHFRHKKTDEAINRFVNTERGTYDIQKENN